MKKSITAGLAVLAIAGSGLVATQAFASQTNARSAPNRAQAEFRLEQLVTEGKITSAQKQLIQDRRAEMELERQEHRAQMSELSFDEREELREERRAQMEEHRAEMKAWAEENGIDSELLMAGPRGPQGQGRGGYNGQGWNK